MNGFSGSRLQVLTCENYPYGQYKIVRKELSQNTSESRFKLAVEIAKAEFLHEHQDPKLYLSPRVLDRGDTWYDRAFVMGETLEEYLERTHYRDWFSWQHRLHVLIQHWYMWPAMDRNDRKTFQNYLDCLWLKAVKTVPPGQLLDEYLHLVPHLRARPYPIPLAAFCHGDLALDNLLVDRSGQLWLIDPLHNIYETPWWDIGKLLQSTWANWQNLRQGKVVSSPEPMQEWSQKLLGGTNRVEMALFFALIVLLRIVRHAPELGQKEALMKRIIQAAKEYLI